MSQRTQRRQSSRHSATLAIRCVVGAVMGVTAVVAFAGAAWAVGAPAGSSPPTASDRSGGIGLQLLDMPADASTDPRARIYIIDHVAPGATIQRRIAVSNATDAAAAVALYASGADITNGAFVGDPAHTANDLSSWSSVSPSALDVPVDQKATATVTIAVPADAAPGEQYGVVWAEVRSTPPSGAGITQVSRVGIRLYVSVGAGNAPASNFAINALTAERLKDGQPAVAATVHNTGGRALDMAGTLTLVNGPSKLSAGPFPATLGTTLGVGDTEPVTIVLDKQLPAGPWDAQITLTSGSVSHTAHATISFPATGTMPAVHATGPTSTRWIVPATVPGIIVLALAGIATAVVLKRRPHGPHDLGPRTNDGTRSSTRSSTR
jgi:hypothetical protein